MSFIDAIVLGVIEGVTEFLPISSTGHLILASDLLHLPDTEFLKTFEIAIQLGAILAVVFLYWRLIFTKFEVVKRVLAAFLPTAILGLAFYGLVKRYLLGNEMVVLAALFLGGVFLIAFEKFYKERGDVTLEIQDLPYKKAVWIGLFQSLALVPGVSRAAATIVGGLILGMKRKTIVEFSFLLAIPTMAAATGWDMLKSFDSVQAEGLGLLAIGFGMAFVTAVFSVKFLIKFIETHNFTSFGVYRILIALVFWIWVL